MHSIGRTTHTLDEKGRIAIPASFKEVMDKRSEDCLIITNYDRCLWGFMRTEWKAIEDYIAEFSMFDQDAEDVIHYFISGAVECPLKGGRITIPLNLRKFAGFEKEIVIVPSSRKKIEFWAAERWEEKYSIAKANFMPAIKNLGLKI